MHRFGILEFHGDQSPEALHLQGGDLVRRIVGQARIAHPPHRRMSPQHHRQRLGVLTLPFEPQARTAEAAQHQPRFEGAENRACEQAVPLHRGHQFGMTARDVSRQQVAVARKRFGSTGHHHVGAQ